MGVEPEPQPFAHEPVLVDEVVMLLSPVPAGTILDATVGGGGHSAAILDRRADLSVVGLDRDADALVAASQRLDRFGPRVRLHRARFDELARVLADDDVVGLSGFLFDLGVSSPQLDRADRGFSFRHDGPLDMRMDSDAPRSAAEIVNEYPERRLGQVIRRYGDERFATRIAAAIVAARPIGSTGRLADVVVSAIPAAARRRGGHPAKRTFQAIRIEVNEELEILEPAIEAALDALVTGGRGLVLTYHSGEDRIVKNVFRSRSRSEIPPGLPVVAAEPAFAELRPLARRPSEAELAANRRASSARLRAVERRAA